jgi:hypothetical protein
MRRSFRSLTFSYRAVSDAASDEEKKTFCNMFLSNTIVRKKDFLLSIKEINHAYNTVNSSSMNKSCLSQTFPLFAPAQFYILHAKIWTNILKNYSTQVNFKGAQA